MLVVNRKDEKVGEKTIVGGLSLPPPPGSPAGGGLKLCTLPVLASDSGLGMPSVKSQAIGLCAVVIYRNLLPSILPAGSAGSWGYRVMLILVEVRTGLIRLFLVLPFAVDSKCSTTRHSSCNKGSQVQDRQGQHSRELLG